MRVGIISSSGGFSFEQMVRGTAHCDVSYVVVTDRECGIERVCEERGIVCQRIVEKDRQEFSRRAARAFMQHDIDFVLLFFNRLVTADLYAVLPTYNIHPALSPAFPGLRALKDARERGVRFVGATLHLVTEGADEGPIVAQVSAPVRPPVDESLLDDISLVQRVYLALLAVELHAAGALRAVPEHGMVEFIGQRSYCATCNPCIVDADMLSFVGALEAEREITVVDARAHPGTCRRGM